MSRALHLLRTAALRLGAPSTSASVAAEVLPSQASALVGCWARPAEPCLRTFASSARGGEGGEGRGKVRHRKEPEDAWGQAITEGDWDKAWEIFETEYPIDGDDMPELMDIMSLDPEAQEKAARRQRELDLQEEAARRHIRIVDDLGRAYATGKRKTSIARVWIWQGNGHMMVNKQPYDQYFKTLPLRNDLITPFAVTGTLGGFDVMVNVRGGGTTGQAQAVRHGVAKALQFFDPENRTALKTAGLLTRDARIVERKKPGRKKARKAFQWVKR